MSTEFTEGKDENCQECEGVMNFVAFIDRKTKKEIAPELVGKDGKPEGPPPGTLKKFRCSNGHEVTRE